MVWRVYATLAGVLCVAAMLLFYNVPGTARIRPVYKPAIKPLSGATLTGNLKYLARGVNVDGLFYNNNTNPAGWEFTERDCKILKKAGFTHFRLPIDPIQISGSEDNLTIPPAQMQKLKNTVQLALNNNLGVVIDFHRQDFEFKRRLAQNDYYLNQFLVFVQKVTRATAPMSSSKIFYEVLNEPDFGAFDHFPAQRWQKVQSKIIRAIRSVAPSNTLVVKGHNDSIKSLMESELVDDTNVVYSIHYYEDHVFTHQGANWDRDKPELVAFKGLPYPVSQPACNNAVKTIPSNVSPRYAQEYCNSRFGKQNIDQDFKRIGDWAKSHGIRLYLSEFGVYKPKAPARDRARWLRDVRAAAELNNISWAVWEYNKSFGFIKRDKVGSKIDCTVVNALIPPGQGSGSCP